MAVPQRVTETLARGNAAYQAGDFAQATKHFRALLRARPRDPQVLHKIGTCYGRLAQADEAVEYIRRAIDIEPSVARWCDLAVSLQTLGRLEEALDACAAALAIAPGDVSATCTRASILNMLARSEEARDLLAPLAEAPAPAARVASVMAIACRRLGQPESGLELVERSLADGHDAAPDERATLLFNKGELLHRMQRYEEAFAAYDDANAIKSARNPFDPDRHDDMVSRIIETWTAAAHRGAPRAGNRNDRPVFILGMPRSGTSLCEQILACHPEVHGGGERPGIIKAADRFGRKAKQRGDAADLLAVITQRDINEASREYLQELPRAAGAARRITDKMTLNFMFIGFIALMLPRTRIIHTVRDPRDTCLSCYFQDFLGALPFTWNLVHLGRYYRAYERLMTHWKSVVDVPILDVRYEELVERPEETIRGMVDYLDLPWNDACLRFHESDRVTITASIDQVRQPIYRTSLERWRVYEAFLGPLTAGLGESREA